MQEMAYKYLLMSEKKNNQLPRTENNFLKIFHMQLYFVSLSLLQQYSFFINTNSLTLIWIKCAFVG